MSAERCFASHRTIRDSSTLSAVPWRTKNEQQSDVGVFLHVCLDDEVKRIFRHFSAVIVLAQKYRGTCHFNTLLILEKHLYEKLMTSELLVGKIDLFLRKVVRYKYMTRCCYKSVTGIFTETDRRLFKSVFFSKDCLHDLLPSSKSLVSNLEIPP